MEMLNDTIAMINNTLQMSQEPAMQPVPDYQDPVTMDWNYTYPVGSFYEPMYEPPCIGGPGCMFDMPYENASMISDAIHDMGMIPKHPAPQCDKVCAEAYIMHCLEGEHE